MNYTSIARRDGRLWFVQNEQFPGAISQPHRLDQAVEHQREAIAFVAGVPIDSVDVSVRVSIDDHIDAQLAEAEQLRSEAAEKQARATALRSGVAQALDRRGFTVRDIGVVLGISHQRAHQLLTRKELH